MPSALPTRSFVSSRNSFVRIPDKLKPERGIRSPGGTGGAGGVEGFDERVGECFVQLVQKPNAIGIGAGAAELNRECFKSGCIGRRPGADFVQRQTIGDCQGCQFRETVVDQHHRLQFYAVAAQRLFQFSTLAAAGIQFTAQHRYFVQAGVKIALQRCLALGALYRRADHALKKSDCERDAQQRAQGIDLPGGDAGVFHLNDSSREHSRRKLTLSSPSALSRWESRILTREKRPVFSSCRINWETANWESPTPAVVSTSAWRGGRDDV